MAGRAPDRAYSDRAGWRAALRRPVSPPGNCPAPWRRQECARESRTTSAPGSRREPAAAAGARWPAPDGAAARGGPVVASSSPVPLRGHGGLLARALVTGDAPPLAEGLRGDLRLDLLADRHLGRRVDLRLRRFRADDICRRGGIRGESVA